jgi:hypothetical protein
MFENNCTGCWHWLTSFFSHNLNDPSLEGLFKTLIILLIIIAGIYGIFTVIAYFSNLAVNFARKIILPIAFMALAFFLLTMLIQSRDGKTCRFSEERYLTRCIPKHESVCDPDAPFSEACQQTHRTRQAIPASKTGTSWGAATTAPARSSWDTVSTAPKDKTDSVKTTKNQPNKTRRMDKNCDLPRKPSPKNPECDSANRPRPATDLTERKERDYSAE